MHRWSDGFHIWTLDVSCHLESSSPSKTLPDKQGPFVRPSGSTEGRVGTQVRWQRLSSRCRLARAIGSRYPKL